LLPVGDARFKGRRSRARSRAVRPVAARPERPSPAARAAARGGGAVSRYAIAFACRAAAGSAGRFRLSSVIAHRIAAHLNTVNVVFKPVWRLRAPIKGYEQLAEQPASANVS
jgi:hypothetical protein